MMILKTISMENFDAEKITEKVSNLFKNCKGILFVL